MFGNQTAALTSKFVFPAAHPFAVYFQYAGEDGSRGEGWRLGNVSLSAGHRPAAAVESLRSHL